jgi:transcriptional regulator with XRE-family HTH domain
MTSLRQLLAYNMKEKRRILGLSQAKLAEKANISTHYVAMIELMRKFPMPEMLEQIAKALDIEAPELFSMPPSPAGSLRKLHKAVLCDIQAMLEKVVTKTVQDTVAAVIDAHIKDLKK